MHFKFAKSTIRECTSTRQMFWLRVMNVEQCKVVKDPMGLNMNFGFGSWLEVSHLAFNFLLFRQSEFLIVYIVHPNNWIVGLNGKIHLFGRLDCKVHVLDMVGWNNVPVCSNWGKTLVAMSSKERSMYLEVPWLTHPMYYMNYTIPKLTLGLLLDLLLVCDVVNILVKYWRNFGWVATNSFTPRRLCVALQRGLW